MNRSLSRSGQGDKPCYDDRNLHRIFDRDLSCNLNRCVFRNLIRNFSRCDSRNLRRSEPSNR